MTNSNQKGDRRERELVNALAARRFAVMRAPASGSATARDLPDVLAGNAVHFYAIEAKSSSGDPIYLDREEVEALVYFAANFGATPLIGVRFDYAEWLFLLPWHTYCTPSGKSYRVKQTRAERDGVVLDALTDPTFNFGLNNEV